MSLGQATKPRWIKRLRAWGSVAVSLGLLVWLGQRFSASEAVALLQTARPEWLLIAVVLTPVQVVLGALRWHRISLQLGMPMGRRHAVEEYGFGVVLNQVLPGGVAGDAVRVWRHKQGHGALGAPLRAALVDRLLGHWAHLVYTVAGVGLWSVLHGSEAPTGAVSGLAIWCGAFALVAWKPPPGLRTMMADARTAVTRGTDWVFHAVISALLVAALLMSFACCALALGVPVGWSAVTAVPLMLLATVVPISVGGWGLRELSAVMLLTTVGWTSTQAIAASAAFGVANLLGSAPFIGVLGRSS